MKSFNYKNVNNQIILTIKDRINQSTFDINASQDISGLDLKNAIEEKIENLKAQDIRLVYSGHQLNDYFSLHHQGIKNKSILYLIPQKVKKLEDDQISDKSDQSLNSNGASSTASFLNVFQVSNRCVRIRKIKLFLNYLIIKLDHAFQPDSIYIFNGIVLDKSKPFEYYNIKNESTIVFIPKELSLSNPILLEKWLKLTNDPDCFQTLVDSKTKKSCSKEGSRLIDLKYNNIELKKNRYRSILNDTNLSKNFSNYYQNDKTQLITNYGQIDSPSVDPLPGF